MNFDDLMRQAGLEAIKDKDHRAAAGQEMTAPEQERYRAACYFACLVRSAAIDAFADKCIDLVAFHGGSVEIEAAIRRMGEDAGRHE